MLIYPPISILWASMCRFMTFIPVPDCNTIKCEKVKGGVWGPGGGEYLCKALYTHDPGYYIKYEMSYCH